MVSEYAKSSVPKACVSCTTYQPQRPINLNLIIVMFVDNMGDFVEIRGFMITFVNENETTYLYTSVRKERLRNN